MILVVATRNRGKLRELEQVMQIQGCELRSLDDWPDLPDVLEDGATFAENAEKKARTVMAATGLLTLADDSGLEVDALRGAPGVYSARYAGEGASDADRIRLLLKNLRNVAPELRTARFRCVMALADPRSPDRVELTEGTCEGQILDEPRGHGGFGYDPVFFIKELGVTFAEMPPDQKNRLSHRGQAALAMGPKVRAHLDIK